jgi:hypothetical protein
MPLYRTNFLIEQNLSDENWQSRFLKRPRQLQRDYRSFTDGRFGRAVRCFRLSALEHMQPRFGIVP